MKINEGDKVGIIENGQLLKGVVKNVYPELDYAVVKLSNCGATLKVKLNELAVLTDEKDQESKEPVFKSEITITREDFRKIVVKEVAKASKEIGSGIVGLAFISFGADLERALFIEGEND